MSRKRIVVDTNVLIAANGNDPEWISIAAKCASRLKRTQKLETVCIDDGQRIMREYRQHLPSNRKGFGDMFYIWLAQNQSNLQKCEQVRITALETDDTAFTECPEVDDALSSQIDPSDRKFIAVANAHPEKPPILQATDSKWIGWKEGLATVGIQIEFIDEKFLAPIYKKKMEKGD